MGGAKTALLPLKQIMKKRNKILLGITALGLTTLFAMPMLYTNNTTEQAKAVKKESVKNNLKKYATYNDESHVITLQASELNNYTWNNLNNILLSDMDDTSYSLEEIIYPFKYNSVTFWLGNIYDRFGSLSFYITKNTEKIEFYNNRFTYYNDGVNGSFEYDLQLTFAVYDEDDIDFYTTAKTAIQADITANEQSESMGEGIVHAIASGLGLIGELASEFLTGFSTLFWANDALTPFGLFALIFLGISVSFAIVKLILNIIRSNTGA